LKARRANEAIVKAGRYMTIVSLVSVLEPFQPKEVVEKGQGNPFPLFFMM
jgi:hypothetical protein